MQHHSKKLCAILLVLCMIISFVPVTAQAALLDGEDYIQQQMNLGEDIVLHLNGNVPEDYRSGSTATISYSGKTDSYTIENMTPDENGLYDLPVEMALAQMTEQIDLVLKAKMGLIDVTAIEETYSVRDYLKSLIEGNYTRETKQVAQELLNYGAWAQKYFGYKTDSLANKGYDVIVSNPVPSEASNIAINGSVPGLSVVGVSLRLLSKTAVRFYFAANNGVDGMTFTVDGTQYTPAVNADGLYYVEVGGVTPKNMDNKMEVAVTDGVNTLSYAYAPIEYFVRSYNSTTDETVQGLMEAGYSYVMATQDFDGVTDTGKLTMEYVGGTANSIQVATNLPAETPLVDFALTDNGCSVNEDGNTKKASNVSMSNVEGKIVLTFNFAEDFLEYETYRLPKNAFFCFTDNSQYALAEDYLFQYDGTSWTQVEVSGDFLVGVDFEDIGNTLLFSGEGPASKAATITRVAHNMEIPALSNGGDYALKLTHASSYYPTFRINFGKELAAGTQISFMAFGVIFGDSQYNHSIFEFNNGGDATVQFNCEAWTQLNMTLPEAADHIDLFWNFDRAGLTDAATTGAVYVDNFVAIEPVEAEGDFLEGVDFEVAGNAALFENAGVEGRDAVLFRTTYANAGISAPANGGEYTLRLTHPSNYWPTFRINFGKTLKAGTVLSFDAYTRDVTSADINTVSIFEYLAGGEATAQYSYNAWNRLSITLAEDCSYLDLVCTMDRWDKTSNPANVEVFLDNFKAVEPVDPSGDILEGYGFEDAGNVLRFGGIGAAQDATAERVSYAKLGIAAPANGGDYALKLSHNSHYYPTFQLNFAQTLKAGTTITFDVYGAFDGWQSGNDMNIEFTGDSGSGQVVYMVPDAWFTATITLANDCDHLQFFWNIERGNGISGDVASYLLIDNVKATLPPVEPSGDFVEGIGFEEEGNDLRFTGIGAAQDATAERATYADLGVAGPDNSGEYALKLSHSSHYYPTFQMNFGKTLKAGTTITFNVYGSFDGWQSGNDMNIEFTGDSGSGQVVYMIPETWFTATITLANDCDHLQFFWNIERGNGISGDVASYLLIDNVKATLPPVEPSGDFVEGIGFEEEGNDLRFTGIGAAQDATAERATYADLGVAGPDNSGEYALKLSHSSHYYPTFQMNFGKTLKAGTTITFNVYGAFDGWQSGNDMNIEFTGDSGSGQVVYMIPETWFTATITLANDCDHLQFFWNIERGNGISGDVASYILIDNVKAVEPDPTFYNGLTFENSSDANYFTGVGDSNAWRDASFEIVSFDGDNALKLTCAASQWPTFRVNFGRTLPSGTRIWFQAYTNDTSGIRNTVSIFEPIANCTETAQYYHGSWNDLEITLTADCDHVDLMCNMDRWNEISCSNIEVYIDNMIILQDITAGADFEMPSDVMFFTGAANGNEWRDASMQIVSKDGSNVLMMTGANSLWPTFRIDFGTTLKAGTTISFDVMSTIEADQEGMSLTFNPLESNVQTDEYGQAVWMLCDEWSNKTITLTEDCSGISFYWDAGRNNLPDGTVSYVYIDNIVVNAA